jgi:RHS repeat-associated protein
VLLGNFALDPNLSPSVRLTDQANGYVIADAVMAVPDGALPNTATWALGVSTPGSYNVYARWTAHANRASNAAYTITHDGGSTVVTVDQQSNGGQWNLLGSFTLDPANNPSVSVTDQANGYVIADAVMAVPENGAPNSAQWTIPVGTYEVYARWTAHPNRATNAPYTVTHAQGASLVTVNQQSNGAQWNLLGNFTFSSAAHNVTLTDEADGYVVADAIRLVSLAPAQAQTYYIHADHLNTPRVITDVNQVAVWRWDNEEPFGANIASEDPDGNGLTVTCNLRFPGQYFDVETGNHYNYFRDYNPETGRYIESDPIGLQGGLNTFGYVEGDPLAVVDPLGLRGPPVRGTYYPRGQMPRPPSVSTNEGARQLIESLAEALDPSNPNFGDPVPGWPPIPKSYCWLVCPSDTPNVCPAPPPVGGLPKLNFLTGEMCTQVCDEYPSLTTRR